MCTFLARSLLRRYVAPTDPRDPRAETEILRATTSAPNGEPSPRIRSQRAIIPAPTLTLRVITLRLSAEPRDPITETVDQRDDHHLPPPCAELHSTEHTALRTPST
jgi:hypothetical protein